MFKLDALLMRRTRTARRRSAAGPVLALALVAVIGSSSPVTSNPSTDRAVTGAVDRRRFLYNEFWYGSIRVAIHGRHNGGTSISHDAEVRFRVRALKEETTVRSALDEQTKRGLPVTLPGQEAAVERGLGIRVWRSSWTTPVPEDETESLMTVDDVRESGKERWTLKGGHSGRFKAQNLLLLIDLAKGTYSLSVDVGGRGFPGSVIETATGKKSIEHPARLTISVNQPLPATGAVLSGSVRTSRLGVSASFPAGDHDSGLGSVDGTITWTLSPVPLEDVELVIAPPKDYADWMPEGGPDEKTKGNSIAMTAYLRRRGGGATRAKIAELSLWLIEVSHVPGVCLNRPLEHAATTPDLTFAPAAGATIDEEGTRLRKTGEFTEVPFTIDSYDWGAWGAVSGLAMLTDGQLVWATLDGDRLTDRVRLPKRSAGSVVADRWKKEMDADGLPDSFDADRQGGNEHDGDGLTLYEEYRGLIALGKHTRKTPSVKGSARHLTPTGKDLIVLVERSAKGKPGIAPGLQLFETASRIHVVELQDGELSADRVVNVNREQRLSAGPQHGLLLADEPLPGGTGGDAEPARTEWGGKYLGHSPAGWPKVRVDVAKHAVAYRIFEMDCQEQKVSVPYTLTDDIAATVAHELAHGLGVEHHGETEPIFSKKKTLDDRDPIKLYDWAGSVMASRTLDGSVGEPGNAASGDLGCLMTYTHYFRWSYHPGDGYYMAPISAKQTRFCVDDRATGANAERTGPDGRSKLPGVFGKTLGGNCLGQMRVKDQGN